MHWLKWIPILEQEFAKVLKNAPAVSEAHLIDHNHRVWRHCGQLGKILGADMEILVAAAYLHDLGRHYIPDKAHGLKSSELAKPILEQIDFPREKRDAVLNAIRVHDVTVGHQDRKNVESQILYDSDKLDSFGVIGVVRNILYYYNKRSLDYILEDIESKWKGLDLPETREYAKKDYDYVKHFFTQLKKETV